MPCFLFQRTNVISKNAERHNILMYALLFISKNERDFQKCSADKFLQLTIIIKRALIEFPKHLTISVLFETVVICFTLATNKLLK